MIEDAIAFAAQAHQGQLDRAGEPYIFHPLRVMLLVKADGGSESEIAAAALHDVVEDTDTTVEEIAQLFSPEVAALVDAMSRREGEDYFDYVERCVAAGPAAALMKRADITDNSKPERLAHLAEDARRDLEARFRRALDIVERALSADRNAPKGGR